ncbi:MAG TPA: hypothetical protein VNI55_00495 [Gaiellaceae bacterium]|nr:hypothetical protein [Gaiellaceae bacterium]
MSHLRQDRLVRWGAIGAVPVVWLAIALVQPLLLLLLPLLALGLWTTFTYGPLERRADTDWSDVA